VSVKVQASVPASVLELAQVLAPVREPD